MKRILSFSVLVFGALLLTPYRGVAASAATQAEGGGPALYLPLVVTGILLVLIIGRQVLARPSKPAPLQPGESRNYGPAGAAVCRSCGLPFARSVLDFNLLAGKLVRCPHCGKRAVLPAASPAEVAVAEQRERGLAGGAGEASGVTTLSEEEQLRRRIEHSKYE